MNQPKTDAGTQAGVSQLARDVGPSGGADTLRSKSGMKGYAHRAVRSLLVGWILVTVAPVVAVAAGAATGRSVSAVATASMAPAVPADSLVVIEPVEATDLGPGDVIAFRLPEDRVRVILHRVVEVVERGNDRFFRTQGDANVLPDGRPVPESDVLGVLGGALPRIGLPLRLAMDPSWRWLILGTPILLGLVERMLLSRPSW